MRQIGTRLADLEKRLAAPKARGNVYRITGGAVGDDCGAFLAGLGIVPAPADRIIQRAFYRPGEAGPVNVSQAMVLMPLRDNSLRELLQGAP